MDPRLQQTLNQVAPAQDAAMHVPAGSVASHLGTTSRSYFYFTTVTLALCLVFAVATIMVLVVQKTDSIPDPPGKFPLKGASKHINKTKLSWNQDGIIYGVRYQDENLVIQYPGWYFIICQLQFLVKCPGHSVDLKLELLIDKDVKKQTLVTVCESEGQTKNIYQGPPLFSKITLSKLQGLVPGPHLSPGSLPNP
ncbi:Tumor necrosis factor ligand superfamily member 8 [Pteropus alecto]|uniref:Tumor necrosis factor ligand superfamily member 8 n=1 Tax=Pteropus alecto TaxID=9402 RepID=L5KBR0_PTEAL|nr:Tumor necrosis factor ligand superfamily member 8 [Pteropus alecto]